MNHFSLKRQILGVAILLATTSSLVISGCGGSNNGPSNNPTPVPTPVPTTSGGSFVTALIPVNGGQIQLPNVATAIFSNGTFAAPRQVSLSTQSLGVLPADFEDSLGINGVQDRAAYQVVLSLGAPVPRNNTFSLILDAPAAFLAQVANGESIRAFARVTQTGSNEFLEGYEIIPATYSTATKKLTIQYNKAWLALKNGVNQAQVTFVTIPGPSPANAANGPSAGSCGAKALGSPLAGTPVLSGSPPRGFNSTPTTHPVNGTQSSHWGSDLVAAQGSTVFAAEGGTIERVKFSGAPSTWPVFPNGGSGGQYIVLRHTDGSKTKYMHLSGVSIAAGATVTKGQPIGLSGGTRNTPGAGGSTGPHLHFEYSPNGNIYANDATSKIDPLPCLTTSDASGSILVNDNGPLNDDVFLVKVDGITLGQTPKGGSDSFGLNNLRPGTKTLAITCLDDGAAGANVGTLGVALNDGVRFADGTTTRSVELALNETVSYQIVVPSASSVSRASLRRSEPPKNTRPENSR